LVFAYLAKSSFQVVPNRAPKMEMKNIFIGGSQLKSDEKSYANETI
jgi:hypothetical protein